MTKGCGDPIKRQDEPREGDVERFADILRRGSDPQESVDALIARHRQAASDEMGRANIVVIGNAGVGKSTLVNAVFRAPVASAGSGRPVTSTIIAFEHPDLPLTIYDTPGLTLVDAKDRLVTDVRVLASECAQRGPAAHLHLAWFCFNAQATRFEDSERETVSELTKVLDVLAVATKCPDPGDAQFLSLLEAAQLETLPIAGPVIPTLAAPMRVGSRLIEQHGLVDLVEQTLRVLPSAAHRALINSLRLTEEFLAIKSSEARRVVAAASTAAGIVGGSPVPFSDAIVLVPLQIAMLMRINSVFGSSFEDSELTELAQQALSAGAVTAAGRYTVQQLSKALPVAGWAISASIAATATAALGFGYVAMLVAILRARAEGRELPIEDAVNILKQVLLPLLPKKGDQRDGNK